MAGERVKLQVQERDSRGSAESRRLRKQGLIPGVLYGRGKTPHPICIPERELRRVLTGGQGLHAILDVTLEGQKTTHPSILKEYQQHPVKGGIIHVDLQEVRLDQPIQARVVVELVGEPVGVTEGGVLSQVNREITVEALPMEIPEHLELDVTGMAIGDTLRLVDLPVQEGVKFLDDPEETVLATVTMPTRIVEPEPEEGEELEEGELPEGELPEGEEAPAEGEEAPAEAPRTSKQPPRNRCASSVGARAPRRWICWSRASATRAASTSAPATTRAGSCSTSWRAGTAAPGARSSRARWRRCGWATCGLALLKPETYMNESGRSVGAAVRFFKVEPEQVLVVHDDVDLEAGRLQARAGGGLAGHNGLRSLAQHLGSQDFLRLRIGVGRPGSRRPASRGRLGALAVRAGGGRRGADRPRRRRRRDDRADGLEAAQQRFN